jgi:hypothetical protein
LQLFQLFGRTIPVYFHSCAELLERFTYGHPRDAPKSHNRRRFIPGRDRPGAVAFATVIAVHIAFSLQNQRINHPLPLPRATLESGAAAHMGRDGFVLSKPPSGIEILPRVAWLRFVILSLRQRNRIVLHWAFMFHRAHLQHHHHRISI